MILKFWYLLIKIHLKMDTMVIMDTTMKAVQVRLISFTEIPGQIVSSKDVSDYRKRKKTFHFDKKEKEKEEGLAFFFLLFLLLE